MVLGSNEKSARKPLLDRLIVRFVASTGLLIKLLERDELDAGVVPSSLNTEERMEAAGLSWDATPAAETIWLDGRESGLSSDALRALWGHVDRGAMEEGFVRDEGVIARTFVEGRPPPRPGEGDEPDAIQLVYASGDEMLDLVARALFEQFTAASIEVELLSIEPHALARASIPGIQIRRSWLAGSGYLDAIARRGDVWPLFRVDGFVARSASFEGAIAAATDAGPFGAVEDWWTRR